MTESLLSALKSCIVSIQLKLSDFFKGCPKIDEVLTERFIDKEKPYHANKGLILLANNHFELSNPVCPFCGSHHAIKQEYRERDPILGEFGHQRVYLRGYLCNACGKKFTTPLDPVVERNHRYALIFKDRIKSLMKTKCSKIEDFWHTQIFDLRLYRLLRKLKEDLITFFGISPSYQSIGNWLKIGDLKMIKNQILNYSGYYCYDEQYIRIDGERRYRLTLFDSVLNIPVSEEITEDMEHDTIYTFLRGALKDKPSFAITTDHRREYKKIMDDLKVKHQLCMFHLFKMIGKDVYDVLKSKKSSYRDKIKLSLYFTEIKEIFRT